MLIAGTILAIVILFFLLGKSADLVVTQIRTLGHRFGIPLSFLGIVLGLLTMLPELSIGVNAVIENVPMVSLGNIWGGVIVIIGLIFGTSLLLNRRITTDGNVWHILPIFAFILLSFIFGLDGLISETDGLLLIFAYLILLLIIYTRFRKYEKPPENVKHKKLSKIVIHTIMGAVAVVILAKVIVSLSAELLRAFEIPMFIIGLLVFSIGTNLPEIVVTIRSWRKHIKELSAGNLIGSAMASPMIIGVLAFLKPIPVVVDKSFYITAVFVAILFTVFLIFYKTGKRLTNKEGSVLISIYVLFVISQLLFWI